ncbi:HNH endonuclease [Providencia sp. PROV145]|uniref:HNH endonuclease n=1 Tax=Providencia sp. PROV145 TaxID=2949855 RepID=UPI00234BE571
MLFTYTYVPHQMERMQRFINFIFYQVWCRARKLDAYNLTLFDANPPLKEIMTSFAYDHTAAGDRFSSQVQSIFQSFAQLSREQTAQFKRWYQGNNNLEKVCANTPNTQLARYADIEVNHEELSEQLGAFFKGLYSQSLLDLAALRAKIGDIDDHYKNFIKINSVGKCPFCGISDLLSEYHTKREAYDHYLPKALYPFNSINFRNLVPACHYCNSSYKTSKNPAYTPKDPKGTVRRRAIFYPYKPVIHAIELQVTLQTSDIENLTPHDIDLQFGPDAVAEEIDTWKDIYGIEERYKAKLCGENDGKYWLTQVLDEWREDGRDPNAFLATLARQTRSQPYAECNFLKKPFLDACKVRGLFQN